MSGQPTLLVLAAGMGSRYGGLKQLDPMGPHGETLLDYSVHDAVQAGFGRIVFVIRRDIEDAFRASVGRRYENRIAIDYVFQDLEDLPTGQRDGSNPGEPPTPSGLPETPSTAISRSSMPTTSTDPMPIGS